MKGKLIYITLIFLLSNSFLYSESNINFPNNTITLSVDNLIQEEPYFISIKYNDTDLTEISSNSDDKFILDNENYKLTESSQTKPFYININGGLILNPVRFEITIESGEFLGTDYNNDVIKSGVLPSINTYNNYEYLYERDSLGNILKITSYIPQGIVEAQHIGAFTIQWQEGENLSSGNYTSTNTISVKSEADTLPTLN
jgi:hypothetical protein